jgi:hypothetical protein
MYRPCVCASLLVLAFVFTATAQEIPFKVEKGYLLITGKVGRDMPFEAAVSTGNTYSFYNGASLKRLGLKETSSSELPGLSISKESAVSVVAASQLTIADQKPVEVMMLPRPQAFDAMSQTLGRKIDFVLGVDYFDGRIVQIDFKSHVIRFLSKPPVEYKSETTTASTGPVRLIFRMTGNIQSIFGRMMTLPVADQITLNGTKVPSLLNTGVVMPVTAGPYVAKKFAAGGNTSSGRTTIGKVVIGDYEMDDVPAMLSDIRDDNDKLYSAVIGLGLLQNFTITLDFKDKWIVLEK